MEFEHRCACHPSRGPQADWVRNVCRLEWSAEEASVRQKSTGKISRGRTSDIKITAVFLLGRFCMIQTGQKKDQEVTIARGFSG